VIINNIISDVFIRMLRLKNSWKKDSSLLWKEKEKSLHERMYSQYENHAVPEFRNFVKTFYPPNELFLLRYYPFLSVKLEIVKYIIDLVEIDDVLLFNEFLNSMNAYINVLTKHENHACPFFGDPPINGFGCKSSNRKNEIGQMVHDFFSLFIYALQLAKKGGLIKKIVDKNKSTQNAIAELLRTFLIDFVGPLVIHIPLNVYDIYFKKVNRLLGYSFLNIDCKKMSDYSCGRAFATLDTSGPHYVLVLYNTVSKENDMEDIDQVSDLHVKYLSEPTLKNRKSIEKRTRKKSIRKNA